MMYRYIVYVLFRILVFIAVTGKILCVTRVHRGIEGPLRIAHTASLRVGNYPSQATMRHFAPLVRTQKDIQ